MKIEPCKTLSSLAVVLLVCVGSGFADTAEFSSETLTLHTRSRVETSRWKPSEGHSHIPAPVSERPFTFEYKTVRWEAEKTASIICDMWDTLPNKIPADRVGEMAPRMNEVVAAVRERGVLIVHAPSGTMEHYRETPQRALCVNAPAVEMVEPESNVRLGSRLSFQLNHDDVSIGMNQGTNPDFVSADRTDDIRVGRVKVQSRNIQFMSFHVFCEKRQ